MIRHDFPLPDYSWMRTARVVALLAANAVFNFGICTGCQTDTVWTRAATGLSDGWDEVSEMKHDSETGLTAVAGNIWVDEGGGAWQTDFAAAAYDPSGELGWFIQLDGGSNGIDGATDVEILPDQSVLVFGSVQPAQGSRALLVVRVGLSGDTLWTRTYQSPEGYGLGARDIVADAQGSFYTLAQRGTPERSAVLQKYDMDGDLAWTVPYEPNFDCYPSVMILVSDEFLYITGTTWSGLGECLTVKFDSSGTLLWDRIYTEWSHFPLSDGVAMTIDSSRNLYVAALADVYGDSLSDYNYRLISYDADGGLRWVRNYGIPGVGGEVPTDIVLRATGDGVHLLGYTGLLTYDSTGNLLSVWPHGGMDLALDAQGRFAILSDQVGATLLDKNGQLLWSVDCPSGGFATNLEWAENSDLIASGMVYSGASGDDWLTVRYNPCICGPQSDLDSSGTIDAVDLALVIDIVFFGGADVQDAECTTTRSDFNADGVVDAVDLAFLIDHVFFGGSAPLNPCSG